MHNPHSVREIPNLRGAIGLTLVDNRLIVTEMTGNRILYVDSGFYVALHGVEGITRDLECNLYATTGENAPLLHKFTRNGILIKSGGEHGTTEGQFIFSNVPRFSKKHSMSMIHQQAGYKCFDPDLNFKRAFGKGERGRKYLNFPADIDLDVAGNVYVTDPWNNRIQVFDSRGNCIRSIATAHLKTPTGVFIRDELIYTTEHLASRISVLYNNVRRTIVTTISISKPNGITVGEDGLMYAASDLSKVVVF